MITLEPRQSEEILQDLEKGKRIFLIGCSGWKTLCNPGGEVQLQRLKGELELKGVPITGTLVLDALCNKGMDELSLFRHFRQVFGADLLLAMSCEVGVQALWATAGRMIVPALRTTSVEGFPGGWKEKEACRLCGDCLLTLGTGFCPLSFCPKGLLNGPCQGANQGRCEVDSKKTCGWELIYDRLKAQGRLDVLRHYVESRDYSEILPLIQLRASITVQMPKE